MDEPVFSQKLRTPGAGPRSMWPSVVWVMAPWMTRLMPTFAKAGTRSKASASHGAILS